MSIYDINGNIISSNYGSNEIPDGSITPAKTSFFNEQPVYRLLALGDSYGVGNLNSSTGSINTHSAYKYTEDYIELPYGIVNLYLISVLSLVCYDTNKSVLSGAVRITYDYNHTDGVSTGQFYSVYEIPNDTKYIRVSTSVENTMIVSLDPIPEKYNLEHVTFSCRDDYAEKIWKAMSIPNLDAISRFKGKTMIVAGDSITEANSTCNNKPWHTHLGKWLDMTIYNDGQGGTGFAKNYYSRGCTVYRIENNWQSLYPTNPDIILVMGNMNDGTGGGGGYAQLDSSWTFSCLPLGTKDDDATAGTQYGVVRRLLNSLIERYPLAKIGMISSTPRDVDISYWSENPKSYGHGWYEDFITAQKYICEDLNIPFLDLYHNNVLRPWNNANMEAFYADGTEATGETTGAVHPNEVGHLEGIARPVLQWMLQWM